MSREDAHDTPGEAPVCQPRRETSGETNPEDTLVLGFHPPERWEVLFPCAGTPHSAYHVSQPVCYSTPSKQHTSRDGCGGPM